MILLVTYGCTGIDSRNTETQTQQQPPENERNLTGVGMPRGLISKTERATPGYVLFSSIVSDEVYLINLDGEVVKTWKSQLAGLVFYLLDNGNLIRSGRDPEFPVFEGGGQGGRIQEFSWHGELLWDFRYANEDHLLHHDYTILPNGNILAIAWEAKSVEQARQAGRKPELIPKAGLWPDMIVEFEPQRPSGARIVWEWHSWDHMIQDYDSTLSNYGQLSEHPELIDINRSKPLPKITEEELERRKATGQAASNATVENRGSDMHHSNSISYNPDLDQIAISADYLSELWIIDHSTTIEEAAGHHGGRSGRGGDLLYRWGNPMNYNRGDSSDQKLFYQHDVHWIPEGFPGAGNIMVFNNDVPGENGNYSTVVEIVPPLSEDGGYLLPENDPYGPKQPVWSYAAPDKVSFYAPFMSGARRLENGNTVITSGPQGRFFEVTAAQEIVWEYWSPYIGDVRLSDGSRPQPLGPFIYGVFRAIHISPDHPALAGRMLKAIDPQPKIGWPF